MLEKRVVLANWRKIGGKFEMLTCCKNVAGVFICF